MDPEEELLQQAPPAAPAIGGTNWDGRVAVNPQTGERVVYRVSPGGRGRFVALNSGAASPESRQALEDEQRRLLVLSRLAPLAEDFYTVNRVEPTGGWVQHRPREGDWLNYPKDLLPAEARGNLDRLYGLEAESVRANIAPGTSGSSNSVYEQQVLRDMFPNTDTVGPANDERVIALLANRDILQARVQAMEEWLSRRPTLDGFTADWAAREDGLRRQFREQHRRRLAGQGNRLGGAAVPGPAAPQQARQAAPRRTRYNAQGQRIE